MHGSTTKHSYTNAKLSVQALKVCDLFDCCCAGLEVDVIRLLAAQLGWQENKNASGSAGVLGGDSSITGYRFLCTSSQFNGLMGGQLPLGSSSSGSTTNSSAINITNITSTDLCDLTAGAITVNLERINAGVR